MKHVTPDDTWLESWRYSYPYDLEEVYGRVSCHGDAYAYENRRDRTLALVEEVVPRGSRILDVAAVQENFSLTLVERGYRVTWNDLRADLVDYVKLKHEHCDITFATGNVFELEFNRAFDECRSDGGDRARRAPGRLLEETVTDGSTRRVCRADDTQWSLLS